MDEKGHSVDLVNNLNSQVSLESGVLKVDQDTTQKYSDHTKGLFIHLKDFQKGLEMVSKFQQKQRLRSQRATKPSKREDILVLNKPARQSIKKFYESFDKLSREEKNLLTKLNEVSGHREKSKKKFDSRYKLQDVLVGLKRMGWEDDAVGLVSKTLSRKRIKPTLANWYGWGSWESSPWKYFFDSAEEWKSKISVVDREKQALEKYLTSKRGCIASMIFGKWGVDRCYSEKSKYEGKVSEAEEAISLHIAAWMLRQMNLLS
ncbi:hypothetical protein [Candidatus Mycoplasma haematominutum]|uniref:hypothetical protein n=1 Tax=Candidatus Mycoplasma haematominutum TaxID=209446 RepID=UPI0002EA4310|nr:hypothetical protein [Candidatus Mycoplasma haematominutum]